MGGTQGWQDAPLSSDAQRFISELPTTAKGWFLRFLREFVTGAGEMRGNDLPDGCEHQHNYQEYLKFAYDKHLEIVLTPDIIWFTLLCEVARIVDKDPEAYRDKFTTSNEKIQIQVRTETPQDLTTYIGQIMKRLRNYVPGGLADKILVEFTTGTLSSTLALRSAFADMIRHYYGYQGCGGYQGPPYVLPKGDIPEVHLEGTAEDWGKIVDGWTAVWQTVFTGDNPLMIGYIDDVIDILTRLEDMARGVHQPAGDQHFLRRIFYEEGNMSTRLTTTSGWFLKLLAPAGIKVKSALEHVARVPYSASYDDGRAENLILAAGLFSRRLDGNVLRPEFNHVIYSVR
jgi:hypothetical protein